MMRVVTTTTAISLTPDELTTLLCKARSAGWELARGYKTEQQVNDYLRDVVGWQLGHDVAAELGFLG